METIRLGSIISIDNTLPILRAQIQTPTSEEAEQVVLLNTWGENAWPSIGSPCIVFVLNCDFAQKYAIPFNLDDAIAILAGEKIIYTPSGNKIYLKQGGSINIDALNDSTKPSINITATTAVNITAPAVNIIGDETVDGFCDVTGVYKVDGVQVVKEQQAAITNPTGGATIDSQARTAITSILTALRAHGLIQT